MAIVVIGSVTVDMNIPQLNLFPPVTFQRGRGRMFFLQTLPNPIPLGERGYFLIIPLVEFDGTEYERPRLTKWFPKNRPFNFKYTSPSTFDNNVTTVMSLYPIVPFGRFSGNTVDIQLSYEDSSNEPDVLIV